MTCHGVRVPSCPQNATLRAGCLMHLNRVSPLDTGLVKVRMQPFEHSVATTTWVETPRCTFECCVKGFSGDVWLTCSNSKPVEAPTRPYQRISFGAVFWFCDPSSHSPGLTKRGTQSGLLLRMRCRLSRARYALEPECSREKPITCLYEMTGEHSVTEQFAAAFISSHRCYISARVTSPR